MAEKPTVLMTGVSGKLGLRVLRQLTDFHVVGVDVQPPEDASALTHFEESDLAQERSCDQLLQLLRAYRPEAVIHLSFVVDPTRSRVMDRDRMWHINVAGSGRVVEAIAEHNRILGGMNKFIFPSNVSVYGPEQSKPVSEDSPLQAQSLHSALDAKEVDLAIQARAKAMKCRTYILRPTLFAGANVQNYFLGILRGMPGGHRSLAQRLQQRGQRVPLVLPSGGNYLEHKIQFIHVDDMARLIAHIVRRKQFDPNLTILNVSGRGDPIHLGTCARMAGLEIKRVPGRYIWEMLLRSLWKLGISDVPPDALPYLLGQQMIQTARLRVFLGEEYKKVIHYTGEEALAESLRGN
ncbi:MAG TPA: NAD-dependent epimerase/dehydratase family protein [Candidatus Angelobacter sp.]|jgi:nucleoside-diphosphate-sugar epimerase|nr:NAD-dependent epimerase/dehydratase family protein [Candidatus Angelobacter sp.]